VARHCTPDHDRVSCKRRFPRRQILLGGLEDVVVFGKTFAAFETSADGRMIARFEDGSTAEGDVLVGADGAGSHVRRQLLPDAQRIDTGLIAFSGKVPLDVTVRNKTPPAIFNGPTLALGPRGGRTRCTIADNLAATNELARCFVMTATGIFERA
jgi:2-polyprenyl-6-methoxyphenol hydroxylase-like FAD-dependent oxidoreductase